MPTLPVASLALPMYMLRRMVAASATFQAAVGAANATEADAHIRYKDADENVSRPCATIFSEDHSFGLIAGGSQNFLRPNGTVFLWLAMDCVAGDSDDESTIKFANFFGGVADDIAALSGADQTADSAVPDSHLPIREMHNIGPHMTPREMWNDVGKFMWGAWIVTWGDAE